MPVVKQAFETITGKVPFATVPGNHESAQIFEAGGYRFLHLALSFNPPNSTLEWAASVIQKYPGLPTIVTTHEHLQPTGEMKSVVAMEVTKVDPEDNDPQMVWDKFLSRQDQIFLVLCGHNPGQAHRTDPNKFGHAVHKMLADYQDRWQTARDVGHEMPPLDAIGDGCSLSHAPNGRQRSRPVNAKHRPKRPIRVQEPPPPRGRRLSSLLPLTSRHRGWSMLSPSHPSRRRVQAKPTTVRLSHNPGRFPDPITVR
jgi:hypothetical protein